MTENPKNVGTFTLYQLARGAGFNSAEAVIASAIAYAESSGKVDATNTNSDGSVDRGLWQINSVHKQYNPEWLLNDPEYNASAAYEVYKSEGWKAWTVWKTGAYKAHLKTAKNVSVTGHRHLQDATDDTSLDPSSAYNRSDLKTGIDAVGDFFNKLTEGALWERVGLIVVGGVLTVVAVLILSREFMDKVPMPPVIPV